MISRYVRPDMASVWSDRNKFETFLKIEILNAEALCERGIVPREELKKIQEKAAFSLERIAELEAQTKHDILAFTRAVSESLGDESRFIHYGLTSTDVVDTANAVLLKQANRLLRRDIQEFMDVLKKNAFLYQNTFCMGRTHGMHADVTVFGLKWVLWYAEMERNYRRFKAAAKEVECGKISGAVGNYAFTDPEIEARICERLGIGHAPVSTQVLQRDRHAHYLSVIALIGATLEKIATEIRHLQRTEVSEVSEAFGSGQKGSSAMPHKHNPISSENICGLARVLRGYVVPAFEDVSLWHERDISHSSVERIILPDATGLLDYMLHRYSGVLDTLVVDAGQMRKNIERSRGVIFSQRVLTALVDKGMVREEAYDLIQQIAQETLDGGKDFPVLLRENQRVRNKFTAEEWEGLFDLNFYAKHVDYIYSQVFAGGKHPE
ncbi:MAG TPA: adenylosuccinate lyase [Candidatus Izemoplasmatales bacterium]|nr:adenylosuccinate lyase [Candidatus Izemoplasmatales bacterium]